MLIRAAPPIVMDAMVTAASAPLIVSCRALPGATGPPQAAGRTHGA